MGVLMVDRVAEIREALAAYDLLDKRGMNVEPPPQELVMREAARAYADLLDSDALIIRRDEDGKWPPAVVAVVKSAIGASMVDQMGWGEFFVESVDVDRAWEVYYQLADRRHKDGLTIEELRQVIEAALVGVVEAEEEIGKGHYFYDRQRFVSPWVEVEG